jgi:hypothetical protein
VPTNDKGIISPDVILPAILQGYSRSNLLVGQLQISGHILHHDCRFGSQLYMWPA